MIRFFPAWHLWQWNSILGVAETKLICSRKKYPGTVGMFALTQVEHGVWALVKKGDEFDDAAIYKAKHYRGKAAADKALAKANAPPAPPKEKKVSKKASGSTASRKKSSGLQVSRLADD